MGLMQLMPATAARYGVRASADLLDPRINVDVGVRHLRSLRDRYDGRLRQSLAQGLCPALPGQRRQRGHPADRRRVRPPPAGMEGGHAPGGVVEPDPHAATLAQIDWLWEHRAELPA